MMMMNAPFLLNNQCVHVILHLKLSLFLQQYDRFDRHIYEKKREERNGYDFRSLCVFMTGETYI